MTHLWLLLLLATLEYVIIGLFVYANRFNNLANINLFDKYLLMPVLCWALQSTVSCSHDSEIEVITMLPSISCTDFISSPCSSTSVTVP